MSHITLMMKGRSVMARKGCVWLCGRDDSVNGGGVGIGDSSCPANVGEHTTMTTVEIDARTLATVLDMAKMTQSMTYDLFDDVHLSDEACRMLHNAQNSRDDDIAATEAAIEWQTDIEVSS